MYQHHINDRWSREPIFPSSNSMKPDGSHCAYFCHVLYDGKVVGTVCAEEMGVDAWVAMVEEDGEVVHKMRETYPSFHDAIEDMVSWYSGQ
jgi:hypothetical protein